MRAAARPCRRRRTPKSRPCADAAPTTPDLCATPTNSSSCSSQPAGLAQHTLSTVAKTGHMLLMATHHRGRSAHVLQTCSTSHPLFVDVRVKGQQGKGRARVAGRRTHSLQRPTHMLTVQQQNLPHVEKERSTPLRRCLVNKEPGQQAWTMLSQVVNPGCCRRGFSPLPTLSWSSTG